MDFVNIVALILLALSSVTAESMCPVDVCDGRPNGDYKNPDGYSQKYFIGCSEGRTLCMPCAATLTFNDELKKCVPDGPTDPPTDSPTPPPTKGSTPPTTKGSSPTTAHIYTKPDQPSPHCPEKACNGLSDGLYENHHPHDKQYFVKCKDGKVICKKCDNGKIFTIAVNSCHSPSHCDLCKEKGPVSSITTSKTTTTVTTVTTTNFLNPSCPDMQCKQRPPTNPEPL